MKKQTAMNFLAFDSSSEMVSVALTRGGRLICRRNVQEKHGASKLIVYIERLLEKYKMKAQRFDAFIVGAGPGSFTGLRVSFSIVKAFHLATGVPLISVPSFLACALQAPSGYKRIAVIADARRDLIYGAVFKRSPAGIKQVKKERLFTLRDFVRKNTDCAYITYHTHVREKIRRCVPGITVYNKDVWPLAASLVEAAKPLYEQKLFTPITCEPIYVYPKDCQIRKL